MKAWRFYAFGDMRLDDIELAACPPDHVLVEPLVVQPSATEAQLAFGIPTLAYDHIKSRLETDAPLQLFGHEFCARIVEVGSAVAGYAPGDRVAARAKLPCGDWYIHSILRDETAKGRSRLRAAAYHTPNWRVPGGMIAYEHESPTHPYYRALHMSSGADGNAYMRIFGDHRGDAEGRIPGRAGYFMYNAWNALQLGIQECSRLASRRRRASSFWRS